MGATKAMDTPLVASALCAGCDRITQSAVVPFVALPPDHGQQIGLPRLDGPLPAAANCHAGGRGSGRVAHVGIRVYY
jgi:hypothetical protein